MAESEKDWRDDWRYVLLLHYEGVDVWLETVGRLPGLPETTARMKVGKSNYFLETRSGSIFYDAASKRTICFLKVQDSIPLGHMDPKLDMNADGEFKPAKAVDVSDFFGDPNFKQIER